MVSETDMKAAQHENRMISKKEGQIRMNVGLSITAVGVSLLLAVPSTRQAYASMSLLFAAALGVWRTGKQSL